MSKRLSALAQLVALHAQHGLTSTAKLVAKTGYSESQIWRAKRELTVARDTLAPVTPHPVTGDTLSLSPPPPKKKGLPHTPSKEKQPPPPFQLTSFVESSGKPDKRPKEATEPAAQKEALQRDFEIWYSAYPRREARGRAVKAYRTARESVAAEILLAGAQQAAKRWAAPCERQFTPLPASWLNGQRWLDEWTPSGPTRPNGKQYDPEFLRLMGVGQ